MSAPLPVSRDSLGVVSLHRITPWEDSGSARHKNSPRGNAMPADLQRSRDERLAAARKQNRNKKENRGMICSPMIEIKSPALKQNRSVPISCDYLARFGGISLCPAFHRAQ